MRFLLTVVFLTISSCVNNKNIPNESKSSTIIKTDKIKDTTFLIKNSLLKVSGSSYYSKSVSYTPVIKNDSLKLSITVNKQTIDSSLFIDIQQTTYNDTAIIDFNDQIKFLKKILLLSKSEFDIKATKSIYLGHLSSKSMFKISTDLSREYIKLYNPKKNIGVEDYKLVTNFLNNSKLAILLNNALKDVNLEVETFKIEKAGLIPFENYSKWKWITTPEDQLPQYLLMAMLWVKVKPKSL